MKAKVAVGTLLLIGLMGMGDMAMAGRIGRRETVQHKRIHQGVTSGELTRHEAQALRHEQRVIDRHRDRARRDGELTLRERVRIENEQDRAAKHIYRLTHNERDRK